MYLQQKEFLRTRSRVQYITFCTHRQKPTLGSIIQQPSRFLWRPSRLGQAVIHTLEELKQSHDTPVTIQAYAVMPNHVHILAQWNHGMPHTANYFAAQCKGMMTRNMLRIWHASEPFWDPICQQQPIQLEFTRIAASQYLREHHQTWREDVLYTPALQEYDA